MQFLIIHFLKYFFSREAILETSNLPTVNVPVLSNTSVVISLAFSNAVLFLISKPFFADYSVDFATTSPMHENNK